MVKVRSYSEEYSYESVLGLDELGVGAPEIVAYARARLARAEIRDLLCGLESVLHSLGRQEEEDWKAAPGCPGDQKGPLS